MRKKTLLEVTIWLSKNSSVNILETDTSCENTQTMSMLSIVYDSFTSTSTKSNISSRFSGNSEANASKLLKIYRIHVSLLPHAQ